MAVGVVLPLVALLLGVAALMAARRSAAVPADVPLAIRRAQVRWRRGGAVVGVAAASVCAVTGGLGVGVLLAAPLFGVFVIAGVLGGELSVHVPATGTVTARIARRTAAQYLPGTLTKSVIGSGVTLVITLLCTSAVGKPDDLGRRGRALTFTRGAMTSTTGPWPGMYYTVPLAVLLVIGTALAMMAVRRIVDRPRPGSSSQVATDDDALRRLAANTVVGAVGVLVAVTLLGVSFTAAGALLGNSGAPRAAHVAGWTLLAATPFWLALLVASFAAMSAGTRRLTVDA